MVKESSLFCFVKIHLVLRFKKPLFFLTLVMSLRDRHICEPVRKQNKTSMNIKMLYIPSWSWNERTCNQLGENRKLGTEHRRVLMETSSNCPVCLRALKGKGKYVLSIFSQKSRCVWNKTQPLRFVYSLFLLGRFPPFIMTSEGEYGGHNVLGVSSWENYHPVHVFQIKKNAYFDL